MRRCFEIGDIVGGVKVVSRCANLWTVMCSQGHTFSVPTWAITRNSRNGNVRCLACQDLSGMRFGKLTVVTNLGIIKGKTWWECKCDCGRMHKASATRLKNGLRSCGNPGCQPGTSHGLSKKSRAYIRWKTMKARCYNPNHPNYPSYGGIGVTVAKRWDKFENFLSDMGDPPNGTVIDRIDNSLGYSPENCRWVSYKKSTENRSNTIWIGSLRVSDFCKKYGITEYSVYSRLQRGWTEMEIKQHPQPIKRGWSRYGKLNPHAFYMLSVKTKTL